MEVEEEVPNKINPKQNANILSKLTFWYTLPIFRKAFKKEIDERELYEVLPEHRSGSLGDRIDKQWKKEKHNKKNSMFLVFWNLFLKYFALLGLTRLITITADVLRPIIIGKLVFFFVAAQTEMSKSQAYLYSVFLAALNIADTICRQNYFLAAETYCVKTSSSVSSFIYRKLLTLKSSCTRCTFFGRIINVVTRDVNMWDQFFFIVNDFWVGLITVIIMCYNMYKKIGTATWIVAGLLLVYIPYQVYATAQMTVSKRQSSIKTDERIAAIQEVISNIRTIKMYVWEKYFEERLKVVRREEMATLLKLFTTLFFLIVTGILIQYVGFYLVLMTCVWLGQQLTSEIFYFVSGTFYRLGFVLMNCFPYALFFGSQSIITLRRLQVLAYEMERGENVEEINCNVLTNEQPRITFKDVTIGAASKLIIKDVNLEIEKGLTLLLGSASSGKSVFLLTILKEFDLHDGNLLTEGKISFASQEPWLFPSTIRQNILFGSKYDEKRYREVVKACSLEYDFNLLEHGDSTVVADRGINLSKGQQSRINLARAIYRESDIYLLDDCLSSLDSLVGHAIFANCIMNFLKNKLVILVTHNVQLIPYANYILTIKDSQMQLSTNETVKHIDIFNENSSKDCIPAKEKFETEDVVSPRIALINEDEKYRIYGEIKKVGSVSLRIYKKCIDLGGGVLFSIGILFIFILSQLSIIHKDKLIRDWANLEEKIVQNKNSSNVSQILLERRTQVLYSFTITTIAIVITILLRAYTLFFFFKKISINLHSKMLKSVIHGNIKFFDTNFTGNIVNRFSKDLITVDENIPFFILHFAAIVFQIFGSMLFISISNLRLLLPAIVLFLSSVMLRQGYLKAGRPLKRLEATTKSPVVGYINATLQGLSTIKAFGAREILRKEFERRQDVYASAYYTSLCTKKAFTFAVDLATSIFLTIVVFQFFIFDSGVQPGDVGLVISQASIMGTIFFYGMAKWGELEAEMTAVERAIEYTSIPPERQGGLELEAWPKEAEIKFENVHLSLNDSKSYILKNINFVIKSGQKLGIVGRTGAGKSSIISALFGLYEIEGKITIDGVDIKTLSLSFLRSKISVIPQDPILLDGSIRDNIDPGKIHSDEEIWKAIKTVNFHKIIEDLEMDLKELDLSCGQKQLISLARVLVNKNKILVLDEMTESLDSETEKLIFETIDQNFESYTIIKIAHKLKFVMACDKILVVNDGQIIEYDSPSVLLQNKGGLFYKMVENDILEKHVAGK